MLHLAHLIEPHPGTPIRIPSFHTPGAGNAIDLGDKGQNVDPKSPYNTGSGDHAGLPPSATANAPWKVIVAAANPKALTDFPNFYFVSDECSKIVYFKDYNDFQANADAKMKSGNC